MRQLKASQKKILRLYPTARMYQDLPFGVMEDLEELHPHELLWSNVDRFLSDQYFANERAKEPWLK